MRHGKFTGTDTSCSNPASLLQISCKYGTRNDIKNKSQSLYFKTHSSSSLPSFINISQNYDSGWKLMIDNRPAILYQSNYALSGIFLPPGNHQIYLYYQPAYFYLSLWISLTSIFISLITIIIVIIWKKRHN